jgi:soluble P-type ATPase
MKEYKKKSVIIAIGDGGNDVSMLMEAHIGTQHNNNSRNRRLRRRRNESSSSK